MITPKKLICPFFDRTHANMTHTNMCELAQVVRRRAVASGQPMTIEQAQDLVFDHVNDLQFSELAA